MLKAQSDSPQLALVVAAGESEQRGRNPGCKCLQKDTMERGSAVVVERQPVVVANTVAAAAAAAVVVVEGEGERFAEVAEWGMHVVVGALGAGDVAIAPHVPALGKVLIRRYDLLAAVRTVGAAILEDACRCNMPLLSLLR